MEILPSEYQHIELSRSEKIFVRNVMSNEQFGYLLLGTNPAMLPNESMHVLLCKDGVLFLKFFDKMEDVSQFSMVMPFYIENIYNQTARILSSKLLSNQALTDINGILKFPANIVYVFPAFSAVQVDDGVDDNLVAFIRDHCLFKEDLQKVRNGLGELLSKLLSSSIAEVSSETMEIKSENVNSILQRIAPEYITIRVATIADQETKAGVDEELLVVTNDDAAVKAFRLDEEQVNIVNRISKGDQLILACAGSGKSVLLIAKCFKAAKMNPDKQFLITCYNSKLYSLYTWFIDRAGLREKNVTCLTFHTLCRTLLVNNGFYVGNNDFDGWINNAIMKLNAGQIKERYYGIFIDEVQQFDVEWYKFCFNLLENKDSDDHLFVICGDKTQKLTNLQKHGRAPWNAGEGYPNYRGGNKNIRIERNYRNCIEINEYINRFVSNAKKYLYSIDQTMELDPDMFLRGKSMFHGRGVLIKRLVSKTNQVEAEAIYESIIRIHDEDGIPYDEIAIIMYNTKFRKKIIGWGDPNYNIETPLMAMLKKNDIPFCQMYSTEDEWSARYGEAGGVKLIRVKSVLGLDFRAAIICGLPPLGEYHRTKMPDWEALRKDEEVFQTQLIYTQDDIRTLYVACTRAKEVLHIILPESGNTSVYAKMMEDAVVE